MVKDMTSGNIAKHLILYSIPLILGNLFQLTYNAVDSIIVGKCAGEAALAAVGAANPVMNIVILGINGLCIGASVLMSEFFGGGKQEDFRREFSTTLLFGAIFSLTVMALGLIFSGTVLRVLKVPEEILDISTLYLRIIFCGMPFTCFYNAYASGMRSVGDSKTPVNFLAFASVLNGCLDYLFIGVFRWGVAGAAVATVIAQAVSAILCVCYVYRRLPLLALKGGELRIYKDLLNRTLRHGSVTALQQATQPIGKLLIQGMVNELGVAAIATFNAVSRVDDFAFTPEQSISHGMMTFIAQNRGARKKERVHSGLRVGLTVEFCYWVIICIVILALRTPIMRLFASAGQTEMIALGSAYLLRMAFFYIMPAFTNGMQGFFRGVGNMNITFISTFIQISVRVVGIAVMMPHIGLVAVAYASLIGWACMLLFEVPYYFKYKREGFHLPK